MRASTSTFGEKKEKAALTFIAIVCLTLIAFALRLHNLGAHSLWYDELLQLDIVQGPLANIHSQLIRHAAMPLDYYLLHGWVKLGRQDTWVRFPALLFGVLAVPLVYALARRLFNYRVGLIAAALLTFSSFAVEYSQEARPYALLLFGVTTANLGLWQVYQTHRLKYWGLTILALAAAVLTHYFALFLLLPAAFFVAGHWLCHLRQKIYWLHAAFFALAIIILTLIFGLNGRLGHLYSVGERFTREAGQFDTYVIPAKEKPNRGSGPPIEPDFFRERVLTPLAAAAPTALLLYNLFFILGVLTLIPARPKNRAAILLLLGWFVLPIILIYAFLLHRGTFFAIRYILYTLPAYLILVAVGLEAAARAVAGLGAKIGHIFWPVTRYIAPGGISLLLLGPLVMSQYGQLLVVYNADSREDWRAVGQLLFDNASQADVVIAVKAEPAINWYYPPAAAPFGAYNRSEPIWRAIRAHRQQWFVLSSYSFKRDQGLRDWLAQQGAVKIAIDRRVVVYFHQEGKSFGETLAQVKEFTLPQKPLTYQSLADQFQQHGDVETSQLFYQRAEELAEISVETTTYPTVLATFITKK